MSIRERRSTTYNIVVQIYVDLFDMSKKDVENSVKDNEEEADVLAEEVEKEEDKSRDRWHSLRKLSLVELVENGRRRLLLGRHSRSRQRRQRQKQDKWGRRFRERSEGSLSFSDAETTDGVTEAGLEAQGEEEGAEAALGMTERQAEVIKRTWKVRCSERNIITHRHQVNSRRGWVMGMKSQNFRVLLRFYSHTHDIGGRWCQVTRAERRSDLPCLLTTCGPNVSFSRSFPPGWVRSSTTSAGKKAATTTRITSAPSSAPSTTSSTSLPTPRAS